MIKGIGIDIIELERIERLITKKPRFLERILTDKEITQYNSLQSERRKLEYLAGRFAAKEAYAKANGTGIGRSLRFTDIEIVTTSSGAPSLNVKRKENKRYHVSISHSKQYAIAKVIIEEK
ncbi:MAG TPA: holo-ACP synthase [Pseudogracilibacillus sp.]|nr:holo-ACP synthase [Pseudogracilibacillus sp.]HZW68567.1 holo-ACP synthase [Pseudogracilibacillus sp.]